MNTWRGMPESQIYEECSITPRIPINDKDNVLHIIVRRERNITL